MHTPEADGGQYKNQIIFSETSLYICFYTIYDEVSTCFPSVYLDHE